MFRFRNDLSYLPLSIAIPFDSSSGEKLTGLLLKLLIVITDAVVRSSKMNMRELHHETVIRQLYHFVSYVYRSPSNSKKILQSRNIIVILEFTTET